MTSQIPTTFHDLNEKQLKIKPLYQNSAAFLHFNHSVTREVYFDWADVGSLWLTALLVFRLNHKRGDVGIIADLHVFRQHIQVYFDVRNAKIEMNVYLCNLSFYLN